MIRSARISDKNKLLRLGIRCSSFVKENLAKVFLFEDKHQIKALACLDDKHCISNFFAEGFSRKSKAAGKLVRYLQRRYSSLHLSVEAKDVDMIKFYHEMDFKIVQENSPLLMMSWSLGCPPNRYYRLSDDS